MNPNQAPNSMQPYNLEIEKAVLGAIISSSNIFDQVYDDLKTDFFYSEEHQIIYSSILELYKNNLAIDMLTLNKELKKTKNLQKAGGTAYLATINEYTFSSANIHDHISLIRDLYVKRTIIKYADSLKTESLLDVQDATDLIDYAEKELFKLNDIFLNNSTKSIEELIEISLGNILDNRDNGGNIKGVKTGFDQLDEKTNGWQPSDFIIIAARPGMGKTSFVLSMALNMAIQNQYKVAFFSLEMPADQLVMRMISDVSQVPLKKIRNGTFTDAEYDKLVAKLDDLKRSKVFVDDSAHLSIFDLRAKARRLKAIHQIDIIIIDYLQLMVVGSGFKQGNREQEISLISRNLKIIAKELQIPIIALAQLNRQIESRPLNIQSRRPVESDLRESGSLEQDADIVSFIYRPEKYAIEEWEDGSSTLDQAEFIIRKFRNGEPGTVRLKFEKEFAKFSNLAPLDYNLERNEILPSKSNVQAVKVIEDLSGEDENGGEVPF